MLSLLIQSRNPGIWFDLTNFSFLRWQNRKSFCLWAVNSLKKYIITAPFFCFKVRVFANCFSDEKNFKADLAAIRIASVNPILDPWIYILLRKSLFRRFLGLSRRGSSSRSSSPPLTQTTLFTTSIVKDSSVFTQLMCNASIITQLPATVTFTPRDTERASSRLDSAEWAHIWHRWMFAALWWHEELHTRLSLRAADDEDAVGPQHGGIPRAPGGLFIDWKSCMSRGWKEKRNNVWLSCCYWSAMIDRAFPFCPTSPCGFRLAETLFR